MAEEKIKQDKKGRLLALREYLYKYTDEQHPVSTQELIDEMTRQGYPGNRKTIKDDIDVLNKFEMDIITNVSRGNSFYMASREFEIPEAVTGKYVRFFERIQSNKSISEVISLEKILANMMAVDKIPEELETQYLLARKYLDSGKKANNEWKTCIGEIDEKLEASIEKSNLYDALKGLQLVEAIPYTKIFKDNGYELDEESKNTVKKLISSLKSEVEQLIKPYLANMYCKSVEGVNTFRNHNTKMQNMLEELGFTNYAMQVKRRKEEKLSNIDEIRSRQEL